MDIFGNPIGGGGGFANPANTELNMNNYKIINLENGTAPKDAINLSQLNTYNPFNQSLNTTDNVQFQNINMNGNWLIPNTQPASINDPNLYLISAQGSLVTIPAGPPFKIRTQMVGGGAPVVEIIIPIPANKYSTLDLCQYIQNAYNTFPDPIPPYIGQMTVCQYQGGYLEIVVTRPIEYLSGNFTIVYDGINTPSSALGFTANITTPCNTLALAQTQSIISVFVGWKANGGSTTPVTNGSPYIYSSSQDKWYTGDSLYTPDFISYIDFNNLSYNLFQNGSNRIKINNADTYLYSPNASNFVNVSNAGVSAVQSGLSRISSTAFETYLLAPNGLTDCAVSNTGVGLTVDTVNRFSALSGGNTTIKSADDQTSMTLTNIAITMIQNGFTKFLMNEDQAIGTSLWGPSGSGRIELINSRINLRQNSVNRFVINNAETYSYSPSLLNYSYKSDTEVATFYNNVNRFSIGGSSSILKSPSTNTNLTLTDTTTNLYVNSLLKLSVDAFTSSINYDGLNYFSINSSNLYLIKNGIVRTNITDTATFANSPSNIMNTAQTDASYTISGGGSTGPRLIVTPADLSINLNTITRIHADSSHSQLISPDGTKALEANNTGVQINLGANSFVLPTVRGGNGQILTALGSGCVWGTFSGISAITNAGTGASLVASSSSIKGLIGGSGISLTVSGTDVTISVTSNNAGFSLFNPLESTGLIGSGNKAYWYICMVPCNCVLNGFKTIVSTGSDPFHVGIYRGRVPNSSLTVLDLLAPIVTPAGGGYYSGAFAIQSGRSNSYVAGEYITVMYHSQGSTNSFYNFIGISDTAIAYTSSANYGNATPPANLGSVPILGTIANRLAIEFY